MDKAFSNLQPFNVQDHSADSMREAYEKWKRNFEYCVMASKVVDATEKRNLLMALGGIDMQDVVQKLPGAIVEASDTIDPYKVLIEKLDEYFAPKRHSILERHLFWNLKQDPEEANDRFLLRLTTEAARCDFGKTAEEAREVAIIDKFLSCVVPNVKEKLLQESDLTLTEMTRKVKAYQASKATVDAMGPSRQREFPAFNSSVNAVGYSNHKCNRCGRDEHKRNEKCIAEGQNCSKCGLRNHFAVCCRTRPENYSKFSRKRSYKAPIGRSNSEGTYKKSRVSAISDNNNDEEEEINFISLLGEKDDMVWARIGGVMIEMLVDSGSRFNIIDGTTYKYLTRNDVRFETEMKPSDRKFSAYAQDGSLKVTGRFKSQIVISDGDRKLKTIADFYVIPEGHQPLLGRETAKILGVLFIGLPSHRVNDVESSVEEVVSAFPHVKGVKLRIPVKSGMKPVSQPVRRVPVAIKARVDETLTKLEKMDIIEEVHKPSEWCSALVIVPKDDGEVRLCVDLRMVNQVVMRQVHPLPTLEDYRAAMSGATVYTKLDFKMFYHQIMLHEDSRSLTTFITHRGMYRYKRVPFGISCAPEMIQKLVGQIFAKCKNCMHFIDDVVIYGSNMKEHDEQLAKVLTIIKENEMLLNYKKCVFRQPEIVFLGHVFSKHGIKPTEEKIEAILKCRSPQTAEEVRSFLGLVNYVGRFIKDLGKILMF